jgi:hypothetical protein
LPSKSRTDRGRDTEILVWRYWKKHLYPQCQVVPKSTRGRDLLKTPPFAPEIKARSDFNLLAWLRQAEGNSGNDIPIVVLRPRGYGPETIGKWPVILYHRDFLELVKNAGLGGVESPSRGACAEKGRDPYQVSVRFGMEPRGHISGSEIGEALMQALFRYLGIEPGNYEMAISRSESQ